jgi:hypothetical protein
MVRVYVGDDSAAVASATAALRAQSDPNRPLAVVPAVKCFTALRLVLEIDPTYVADAVYTQVRTAVVDNIFAPGVLALGEPLYRSRVEEVVTAVPGVVATHRLRMLWFRNGWHLSGGPRFRPGAGGFFALTPQYVLLSEEVSVDD